MIYVRECFAVFSSESCMVSCHIQGFKPEFEFIFVIGVKECSNFIDLHESPSFLNTVC